MPRPLWTAACVLHLLAAAAVGAQERPEFVGAFARRGHEQGQVRLPGGVSVDAQGDVYVAEIRNNRIQRFTADGNHVDMWSGCVGQGPLNEPSDVAIDDQDRVWVADRGNNRIVCFTREGECVDVITEAGGLPFSGPNGVGIHPSEPLLYVADTFNGRISVFDITEDRPRFAVNHGIDGNEPGQLGQPTDVAISSRGEIHVSEPFLNRIQIFSPRGSFRLKLGTFGERPGRFNGPVGIALDPNDNIYVVDTFNGRIQKFRRDGVFVMEWGPSPIKVEHLNSPLRIHITPTGLVYVCDTPSELLALHRIVIFQLDIVPVEERTWSDIRSMYRGKRD